MSALTPRERQLLDALERLTAAAAKAEAVMRAGRCPACQREAEGDEDAEAFALSCCSTMDWLDIHDALAAAESAVADAQLDAIRPGRRRLSELTTSMVALDLAHSKGLYQ